MAKSNEAESPNTGEFTVKGVVRESLALFFSKSFFVFVSVPFFLYTVQWFTSEFLSSEFVLWNAAVLMCWLLLCCFILFFSKNSFNKHLRASIIHVFFRQSSLQLLSLLRKYRYLNGVLKSLFIFASLPFFFFVATRIDFIFRLRGLYSQDLMWSILGNAVALACWLLTCGFILFFNKNSVIKNLFIFASVLFLISVAQRFMFSFFYYGSLTMRDNQIFYLHGILGNVAYWMRWLLNYGFACAVLQALSCGSPSFSESLTRVVRRLPWLLLAAVVIPPMFGTVGFVINKLLGPDVISTVAWVSFYLAAHALLLLCVCPLWFAVPACIIEKTGIKSLSRSVSLTKGRYWAVFFLLIIVWLSSYIISTMTFWVFQWVLNLLRALLSISTFDDFDGMFHNVFRVLSSLLMTAVSTFGYIAGAVAYRRLRVVKEGASFEENGYGDTPSLI